jgi:peptidoglycan hydrolase-like protein with peptidoglycan-binding domain
VSAADAATSVEPPGSRDDVRELEPGRPRQLRRWGAGALLLAAALAVVLIVADPFGGGGGTSGGVTDNEYPVSMYTVTQQALTSQTQVTGTLGFTGSSRVLVPAGTAPSAVAAAEQSVTSGEQALATGRSTLAADSGTLALEQASVAAAREKQAVDCAGNAAAESPSSGSAAGGSSSGLCASDQQALATDQQALSGATTKVAGDRASVAMAATTLASAQDRLAAARSSATLGGAGATFTELPAAGQVISRGQRLYAIGGQPVVLLYGAFLASRAFVAGMSPGPDVAELNANLDALGDGRGLAGDAFTAATAAAVRAFQAGRGISATGELLLGSVVFETGAVRVSSVIPVLGATVGPGPVLGVTSATRKVTIELDAAEQGSIAVGDAVTITLPDNQTTPGRVTYVASVAEETPDGSGGSSPTIEVEAVPTDPTATGGLDEAPVDVAITTASVERALVVPVDALLALSGGGYAVEEVAADGVHHLVAVNLGIFDDADGLVQVTGAGIAAGQRVVVPSQ